MENINKNKHLSYDDRLEIEKGLKNNLNFKEISEIIHKDSTTISKEIRNHIIIKDTGAVGRKFFDCVHRNNCQFRQKGIMCNKSLCEHYEKENCKLLNKAPYVCNGCKHKSSCTLTKHLYEAEYAYQEYKDNLKECREGINFTPQEIKHLDEILKSLIVDKGQSIHHACISNKNEIMVSEREIYNLIDSGILSIKNYNLPRKVRFRNIPKRKTYYKIDKKCLENRRYEDYLSFIQNNPDTNIVQMDTVEGIKGGKVLLTIHFVNCSFMLAFIRDHNDAKSVIDIFNNINNILGTNIFKKMFPIILTDNGSEFSNPLEIEINPITGEVRTQIFYCEPGRSDQKGSCEVNHELIRRILPKGKSLDNLTQEDINNIMSNINSYKREKLNNFKPIELFNLMYGKDIANKLGIIEIDSNSVNLKEYKQ